jgi:transposase-like protein
MNKPPSDAESPAESDESTREKRFSARRKIELVLRLLKGESLDALSRETGLLAAKLSQWRDEFLAAGEAGLKSRPPGEGLTVDQKKELQAKVGELTMDNELLRAKIAHLEQGLPPVRRKSKR